MKEANVLLSLSKDHQVHLKGVTPIEALLLAAEHHANAGGNPLQVDKESVKETGREVEEEYEHEVDSVVSEGGVKKIKTEKVKAKRKVWKDHKRSVDEEISRLRGKYPAAKIRHILNEVKELPTEDFEKAIQMGINIVLPSGKLAEARII